MTNNYELKIISRDEKSEGKVLKKYVIDGQETIGVHEGEPFEILFKNKTWSKVQVKISIDGTDILTGSLANTVPDGNVWVCEPYGTIKLKAWPESAKGGAEFLFSKTENSVAANTHGNMSGKGIIAAAVFVESLPVIHNGLIKSVNLISSMNVKTNWTSNSSNINQSLHNASESQNLAVGAGDYVDQNIIKVAGLSMAKLETIISIKYESWISLRSKALALQKNEVSESNPGFPVDASIKLINLKGTPKGRKRPSRKSSRLPDLQRF